MVALGRKYILFVRDFDSSVLSMGILVHELQHLMNFVLEDIGEPRNNTEWEAYFMQSTYMEILHEL